MTGVWLTWGKHAWNTNNRGKYTLKGMVAERTGGWMHLTLRHPYEDLQLRFDQHERPYRAVDALRLEHLLRQLIDEEKLQLLGDPEWVGRAVAHLAAWEEQLADGPCAAAGGEGGRSHGHRPLTAALIERRFPRGHRMPRRRAGGRTGGPLPCVTPPVSFRPPNGNSRTAGHPLRIECTYNYF